MNELQNSLNLARRLRPQTFSQIIGQDVPVKMLKNSLYTNKFFPVYLFSGQRGCGKTSTARVFAAAVNCEQLPLFQKTPTLNDIPCRACSSCLAMQAGAHPDFIEIDAASNTGVDNVRQIIETATYVPLQGKKKIYLIDEAHMLSKSAFNALLKILEEPPVTVLFMLATTEINKIPQTVLSRCFQLLFPALETFSFSRFLLDVCKQENIAIENEALSILIESTEGSARDALNLLEQIRFMPQPITADGIRRTLGKLSVSTLVDILNGIGNQNPITIISVLQNKEFQSLNPQAVWDSLVTAFKNILWLKYAKVPVSQEFSQYQEQFEKLSNLYSQNKLLAVMQLLWDQEIVFLQTSKKHLFLEFLLIQLAEQENIPSIKNLLESITSLPSKSPTKNYVTKDLNERQPTIAIDQQPPQEKIYSQSDREPESPKSPEKHPDWLSFLTVLREKSNDLVLLAIFEQAQHKQEDATFTIQLRHHNKFFTDKIEESKSIWRPILEQQFGILQQITFSQQENTSPLATKPISTTAPLVKTEKLQAVPNAQTFKAKNYLFNGKQADNKNKNVSQMYSGEFINPTTPFATLLISHFPGKLKKLKNFN